LQINFTLISQIRITQIAQKRDHADSAEKGSRCSRLKKVNAVLPDKFHADLADKNYADCADSDEKGSRCSRLKRVHADFAENKNLRKSA
jgi:hypothetical protein